MSLRPSFLSHCSYFIYRFVVSLIVPLAQVLRPGTRGKLNELLSDKCAEQNTGAWNFIKPLEQIQKGETIWIHAASGEIEYARPVIRSLIAKAPHRPIIVTYSSPSAKKILRSIDGLAAWGPVPWDREKDIEKFITRFQITTLLVARTDLWPAMAAVSRKQGLRAYLFSATFAANSSRLRGFSKLLTTFALSQLDEIFVVSKDDQDQLAPLSIQTPTRVLGDTRYDQVFHRLSHPKALKESLRPKAPCLIIGSSWSEDEKEWLPMLPSLIQAGWSCVIAPHEVHKTHIKELIQQLESLGLDCKIYSQAETLGTSSLLIVDQVGILAELYQWGHLAFVGGSFKRQVHSVMEPLAAGLPVCVGPYHENNREALLFAKTPVPSISRLHFVNPALHATQWEWIFSEKNFLDISGNIKQEISQKIKSLSGSSDELTDCVLKKK